MAGRRGNFIYLGLIAFVVGAGWLGVQLFGTGSGRPFSHSDLAALVREIRIPPIDLAELDFGIFQPSKRHAPLRAQVRYADEMELALVKNRNQLLTTVETRLVATQ